jgi:hypothetical protein
MKPQGSFWMMDSKILAREDHPQAMIKLLTQ